ncbi:MAG: hypothetical protein KJ614_08340 [Gammaproteobacteria bacterium]|uniref:hypothetical protein n=1 Tax=Rhodoferax sp. TaxID=50421 RepID=UPI00181AF35B|nr:hypothetical protein [Rhodoferax sp.]MBU3898921.1 hypothetical protein [Gammaproteobacteria bacterium]MBA3059268.1 hypothetical protein [Rhodoferax sp.]MBU3997530.1 hypothetical protein [Gammaproteobacteria bacterium]MBU4018364.1 hypothetical protein [Gammaproteobacteria bacterium]MBU4080377.1 hypothetical protein [Gammaproteobacteria bacterium]
MKIRPASLSLCRVHLSPLARGLACAALVFGGNAGAQTQVLKPPLAQYWMDVATMSMAGMDEMPDMPDMSALGGMMGGMTGMPGMGGVSFGATHGMMPGRWLDLAVVTQRKPAGTEATQTIPSGQNMGKSLTLLPVQAQPDAHQPGREGLDDMPERPKGRILFYWGCSERVRPGQPRMLDFSKASAQDYGKFMMGRAARDSGAKATPGHAVWPNEKQRQKVPTNASLTGEHALSGDGLPASFKFALGQAQDFMPKLALSTQGSGASATQVSWLGLPTARAYFLNAMSGSDDAGEAEIVIWSSAELPEPGWGLMDYASNAHVDQWLKEKVLLPASQTRCAIPAGIFAKAQGTMLRGIAYGQELNLAYPPRPTDKRIAWEPEWAAKVRVKSVAMAMFGDDGATGWTQGNPDAPPPDADPENSRAPAIPGIPGMGRALKGLFGR